MTDTKKEFGYNEVKQYLQKMTDAYHWLNRGDIDSATRQFYERQFCESAGWFVFYAIHVEYKGLTKGYMIVDPSFKDRIINDEIIDAFTALKAEIEKYASNEKKIVQLIALLESEGYSVDIKEDKITHRMTADLVVHRKVFNCGRAL